MKVDKIIKNAKIFTADKTNPEATALVVKDGKFIYVGDESWWQVYHARHHRQPCTCNYQYRIRIYGSRRVHCLLQQEGSTGLYVGKYKE